MSKSPLALIALALLLVGCPTRGSRGGGGDGNASPSEPEIAIEPATPVTGDDLTLVIVVESIDPEDDGVTYDISWTVDGEPVEDLEDAMLVPSDLTAPDQVWEVTVRGNDGEETSDAVTASVTVTNTPPTAPQISISPAAPGDFDDLLLVYDAESTDAEGDPITYQVEWTVNGTPVTDLADPNVVPASRTSLDETWAVTVVADDGLDQSKPDTDSVLVDNAAPTVSGVTLTTAPIYTNDTITVNATGDDAEGDAVTLSYTWFVNGFEVGETGSSLDGAAWFDKNQEVYVVVTPSDPFGVGEAVESNIVGIFNSPPGAPTLEISPSSPVEQEDNVVCEIVAPAFDADGDVISYTFAWDWDGTPYTGTTTFETGDTVHALDTVENEVWTCQVTPFDGEESGLDGLATVVIDAAAPDLIVDGAVVNLAAGTYIYDDIEVINGGSLQIDGLTILEGNSFFVDATSLVNGAGAGESGGSSSPSSGSGPGGGGTASSAGSGGGGYGGAGGDGGYDSSDTPSAGGGTYGTSTGLDIAPGSGGGGATGETGGDGGAALWVIADDIEVLGEIDMRGATGSLFSSCASAGRCAGGGAGGGILLQGDTVIITGLFDVSGGDGSVGTSTSSDSGGGGGGGRVKVFYDSSITDTATFDVSGGTGGPNGGFDGGDNGGTGTGNTQFMAF